MARTNDGIHMTIPGYIHAMRGLSDRIRGSVAAGPGPGCACRASSRARPPTSSAASRRRGRADAGDLARAVAGGGDAGADAAPTCCSTLVRAGAPFLARLRASRPGDGAPVHIIQIGDSHTAGDMITSGWRTRLQARYGAGGRGVLAAGRPYQGYLTWGVTASQSAGWSVNASFGGSCRDSGRRSAFPASPRLPRAAGETLGLSADTPDQAFRPDHRLRDRPARRRHAAAADGRGRAALAARRAAAASRPAGRWTATCRSRPPRSPPRMPGSVSVTSFGTFRREGGVVLSNLGVVGAQLTHFGRTSDEVVRAEFAAYRPDLIVLAFGTNEGFSPSLDPDAYEAALRDQIARIRRLAGRRRCRSCCSARPMRRAASRRRASAGGRIAATAGTIPRLLGEVRGAAAGGRRASSGSASGTGRRRWAAAAPPRSWVQAGGCAATMSISPATAATGSAR